MLNVIILAGNAVADPVVRTTGSGKNIATVRLAVNNPLNDEEVLYIDVDTWDKQSEFVQKYVKKGNSLSVVGRLKSREYTGNDGIKRTAFSVVCERVNFIGSKKKSDNSVGSTSVTVTDDSVEVVKEVIDDEAFAATAAKAMAKIRANSSTSKINASSTVVAKSGDEF
jgi:single-strand DNA-binding protein